MSEHTFVRSFHKLVSSDIFVWKVYDPYQGGVPDAFLVGTDGLCLFIEYKYTQSLPKKENTKIKPALSAQQSRWLQDKIARGLSALVILGSKDGVVIFRSPTDWDTGLLKKDCEILTPKEAASVVDEMLGVRKSATELEIQSLPPKTSGETCSSGEV